jgi:hydrogenase maturation factor HypF (carbamoyltransferase family)
VTEEATGVVVAVETGDGLGDVRGFTLRVAGGELLVFSLRELQNAAEFAPSHLIQHQADAYPLRVVYRTEGTELLALQLEDAPP